MRLLAYTGGGWQWKKNRDGVVKVPINGTEADDEVATDRRLVVSG